MRNKIHLAYVLAHIRLLQSGGTQSNGGSTYSFREIGPISANIVRKLKVLLKGIKL